MNLNTKCLSFCLVSVPFLISFCLTLEAGENFSGDFDVNNWSTAGSTGNGSVDTSNAPNSITITGPDDDINLAPDSTRQKFFIQPPLAIFGTYSFDWVYTTNDGPVYDFPQLLNGSSITSFDGYSFSGSNNQSGSISVDVAAGDIFGFEVFSEDSCCGAAFLTISSLLTPESSSDTGDATYSISGTTTAGSVLTAAVSEDDADGNGTVNSYQWQSSTDGTTFTSIAGATSSTYTLTASEEGKYVQVIVNYTDGAGFDEEVSASSITIPHVDSGDAEFIISGSTYAGKVLTASISSSDPDGDGTFSYQWQSSTDGTTFTSIAGATSSTYTLTASEEGKYIQASISYTDSEGFSESILVAIQGLTPQMHSEWLQPYAAMQNIGLKSIQNNRDLALEKAGECNNYGWVIGASDYCLYTNANNIVSYVKGDSTKGSYRSAVFNSSLNLEKTLNEKWKGGIAYGVGSSNLNNFNFSSTTASFGSTNTHYSIYGVKKVNDTFTLKGIIGGSDFDYKGKRNYLTTSATSSYDSDGYTAEINGIWDIKKIIKNMKTPIRLKPSVGVAYAAHTQEDFNESGSGDLITIDANQAESLLFKTGISIDKQISMEGGKWLLVPSLALNYEMDTYADDSHRSIKGGLTESSTEHILGSAKTFGQHNGSLEVGADFVCTKNFMFNLKAEYGLAEGGDEYAYGGGFIWQF